MTGKVRKQNYLTSLRIPEEMHRWVSNFADRWEVPTSYIYRSAIRDFIQKQSGAQS